MAPWAGVRGAALGERLSGGSREGLGRPSHGLTRRSLSKRRKSFR